MVREVEVSTMLRNLELSVLEYWHEEWKSQSAGCSERSSRAVKGLLQRSQFWVI